MVFTIEECSFNEIKVGKHAIKEIFRTCFPKESWASAIPFPNDTVFLVKDGLVILGFCMVHETGPDPKDKSYDHHYLYNLCVSPKFWGKGVGTTLLGHLKKKYDSISAHMMHDDIYHTWFMRRGWKVVGKWREKFITYVWTKKDNTVDLNQKLPEVNLKHYDPDENIIYLN